MGSREDVQEKSPHRHFTRRSLICGGVIVVALTLGFFLLFWNRFVGIRAGNGSIVLGQAILAGKLPYRDWFFFAPPLYLMKMAALVQLFGDDLIMPRVIALFERSLLALVVFFWLARLFRVSNAAIAAAVAIVISAGDGADPLSSYNHDTIFYGVVSGFFASFVIDRCSSRSWGIYAVLSGLFAGLCISNKQTIGIGITVGIPVVLAAWAWASAGVRRAAGVLSCFALGWLIPIGATFIWLANKGILGLYFRDVFFRGPSAKGTPGSFAYRMGLVMWAEFGWLVIAVFALVLFIPVLRKVKLARNGPSESLRPLIWAGCLGAVAISAGAIAAREEVSHLTWFSRPSIYFVLFGSGLLASYYCLGCLRRKLSSAEAHFWLLSTVSFSVAFMLSLSWPTFEAMVIPGLGFFVAALLEVLWGWRRYVVLALCGGLLFSGTLAKLERPYGFQDWVEEPVSEATTKSSLPEMKGFLLPAPTVSMIDGVTRIIREHSSPGDTIFTYPTLPIFYALSGQQWPTYSVDENLDVTSDALAREDAAALIRNRPAVIVYYEHRPGFMDFLEKVWRRGNLSGQRDLVAAIRTLSKEYQLAGTFYAPRARQNIMVFVRPR